MKKIIRISFVAYTTASMISLSGCFLAPTYHRPTVEAAPTFKEEPAVSTSTLMSTSTSTATTAFQPAHPTADRLARGKWWEIFNDPQLNALEEKVVVSNQNIKQAEATYREEHAAVTVATADYFPTITANPSATRQHSSGTTTHNASGTRGVTYNDFDLPVSAGWEPDFWGRTTMEVRSAKANAQASAAALESMRLSMEGELASDYFSLAAIDMQEKFFHDTINNYQQTLQLTQARYNGGIASQADVAQAQTQLESASAQYTDLGITRAQLEHAIAVLTGQSPSTFSLSPLEIHGPPVEIPVGVPSQLLERRPDIAEAERTVVSANQEIGVARTAFFPTISLTATGGFESGNVSNWISQPSRIWSLGASASQTLLDFGRTIGYAKEARANYDATIASYRQTVLAAFQEVEDNLAAERLLEQEYEEQSDAVKAAQQSLHLQMVRYQVGVVSELDLIVVQNTALQNEITFAQIQGRQMNAAVTLMRAVGGGWDDSQLPWPTMLTSKPDDKNTPLAPDAAPNDVPIITSTTTVPSSITASSTTITLSTGTVSVTSSSATVPSNVMTSTATPTVTTSTGAAVSH